MNNDPLFLGKTCRESIQILSQNMILPFFPLITTSSVYNRPESQICAQLQTGRMQQKIPSHTIELTCPQKTWLHFSPPCF